MGCGPEPMSGERSVDSACRPPRDTTPATKAPLARSRPAWCCGGGKIIFVEQFKMEDSFFCVFFIIWLNYVVYLRNFCFKLSRGTCIT